MISLNKLENIDSPTYEKYLLPRLHQQFPDNDFCIATICGETIISWYNGRGKITIYPTWPLIRYQIETGVEDSPEFKSILKFLEKILIEILPKYVWADAFIETRRQKIWRMITFRKPRFQRSTFNQKTKEFTDHA